MEGLKVVRKEGEEESLLQEGFKGKLDRTMRDGRERNEKGSRVYTKRCQGENKQTSLFFLQSFN